MLILNDLFSGAILNLMSWKSISVGAYACPDEVILSTLLVYGRGFSSGE
tara:strand:- start:164 stop:310 length:147 start_codon:yes stop_codon:yes gene_type:complete